MKKPHPTWLELIEQAKTLEITRKRLREDQSSSEANNTVFVDQLLDLAGEQSRLIDALVGEAQSPTDARVKENAIRRNLQWYYVERSQRPGASVEDVAEAAAKKANVTAEAILNALRRGGESYKTLRQQAQRHIEHGTIEGMRRAVTGELMLLCVFWPDPALVELALTDPRAAHLFRLSE